MTDRRYYIEAWCDEIVPCDCSLQGWANWLAKPDKNWGRETAAEDRQTFAASVTRFDTDVIASKTAEGWTFDRLPSPLPDFVAVRFGAGLGWDADSLMADWDDLCRALNNEPDRWGDVENIAVGYSEPDVMLRFKADPPRMLVETVQ